MRYVKFFILILFLLGLFGQTGSALEYIEYPYDSCTDYNNVNTMDCNSNFFGGPYGNYWMGASVPTWIQADYGVGVSYTIIKYTVGTPGTQTKPENWTFEGTNDNIIFDVLDTEYNQFPSGQTTHTYLINNTESYRYYRVNVTGMDGTPNGYISLETHFFGGVYYPAMLLTQYNNITNNDTSYINIESNESINLSVAANQTISNIYWYKNGVLQSDSTTYLITSFYDTVNNVISVSADNTNGTSNTITWNLKLVFPNGTVYANDDIQYTDATMIDICYACPSSEIKLYTLPVGVSGSIRVSWDVYTLYTGAYSWVILDGIQIINTIHTPLSSGTTHHSQDIIINNQTEIALWQTPDGWTQSSYFSIGNFTISYFDIGIPPPTFSPSGYVKSSDNILIPFALVTIYNSTYSASDLSDASGYYSVSLPADGTYNIVATKTNYSPSTPASRLFSTSGTEVNLTLSSKYVALPASIYFDYSGYNTGDTMNIIAYATQPGSMQLLDSTGNVKYSKTIPSQNTRTISYTILNTDPSGIWTAYLRDSSNSVILSVTAEVNPVYVVPTPYVAPDTGCLTETCARGEWTIDDVFMWLRIWMPDIFTLIAILYCIALGGSLWSMIK